MSDQLRWPREATLLPMIQQRLAKDGTRMQVIDQHGLEAGIDRARTYAGYEPDAPLSKLAAVMMEGITQHHPLQDGNKRAAFFCAMIFLVVNGKYPDLPQVEVARMVRAMVTGDITVDNLAAFFEAHLIDLPPGVMDSERPDDQGAQRRAN